jgi:hypothetical protein
MTSSAGRRAAPRVGRRFGPAERPRARAVRVAVSQYPRAVLADVTIDRDGGQTFVKAGTVLDCPPGSELETAYGGASNLSAVTTGPSRSP